MQTSRDVDSRKLRALLYKPSRDGVSRKPRAFMQIGQVYTEIRVRACIAQLGKGRKKETKQEYGQDKKADRNSTDNEEAYQVTPTLVPHPSGGQPTPPLFSAPLPPPLPP